MNLGVNKYRLESLFFLFFGLFHIHRIWAFIDAKAYNDFWLNMLNNRNIFFYIFGVILIILTLAVIIYFLKHYKEKKWWRWIYLFGGGYVLIDCILNLFKNNFIINIVIKMYTLGQPYYNIVWGFFILLGIICIIISKCLWNYSENKYNKSIKQPNGI
jgi:hypothetical protein